MSILKRVFKCLGCECELDDTVYGAYCNRCLDFDDSVPELVSRETIMKKSEEDTEEITAKINAVTCVVCNKIDQLNDLCLCNKCYKEHLHFAVDESEDVEDSDLEVEEQDLIDAQHAMNDNEEYTEEENAEYFRLNPQPPLERRCCDHALKHCEGLKEEIHR
jgi:hypothetical protein